MVREIMKDPIFLAQKSAPATAEDSAIGQDLLDTLAAHKDGCVGMAANMIGVAKRIIVFDDEGTYTLMYNPEIVKCSQPYEAEEGCLSLAGVRKTTRYEHIEVVYQDMNMKKHRQHFDGYVAQIIQHEIDHCNGILI